MEVRKQFQINEKTIWKAKWRHFKRKSLWMLLGASVCLAAGAPDFFSHKPMPPMHFFSDHPLIAAFLSLFLLNWLGKRLSKKRNGPVYSLLLLALNLLPSCSPLGERVKPDNDNFYFTPDKKAIRYSPMGNWFELDNSPMPDGTDLATFEPLDDHFWARDSNRFYYGKYSLEHLNIDRGTFRVLEIDYAKDKNQVYVAQDGLFPGPGDPIRIVRGADPATYENSGRGPWTKDAFHYFYDYQKTRLRPDAMQIVEEFAWDERAVYVLPNHRMKDEFLEFERLNADPKTFREAEKGFFRDEHRLYRYSYSYQDQKENRVLALPFDDYAAIRFFDSDYQIIGGRLYHQGHPMPQADASTFQELEHDFVRDKNALYYWGHRFEEVDFETLRPVDNGHYYQDKNFEYFGNRKLPRKQ